MMLAHRFLFLLFFFALAIPSIGQQEERGCQARKPEELRNGRFLVDDDLLDSPAARMVQADRQAPRTTKQKDCTGSTMVTVLDMPEESENRSNLGSIVLDTAKSSNYRIYIVPFTPGTTRKTLYSLIPIDYRKAGLAIVHVRDMAGNLTVDTVVYDARPIVMRLSGKGLGLEKVRDGDDSEIRLWMKNIGEYPAAISRIALKTGGVFSVVEPKGNVSLDVGDSVRVVVKFTARLASRAHGLIVDEDSIGFAAGDCVTFLNLVQRQIVQPRIMVTDRDFGAIPAGVRSGIWMMQVRNVSMIDGSTLTVYGRTDFADISSSAPFRVDSGNASSSFRLEPGQERVLQITTRPEDAKDYRDTIIFSSDAMEGDSIGWVKVRGLSPMAYGTSFDWGRGRRNHTYGPVNIYVHNIADIPVTIVSLDVEGDETEFTVLNRNALAGSIIRSNDSLQVQVQFNPTSTGWKQMRIIYQTGFGQGNKIVSELGGFGTAPQLLTANYNFGDMPVGGPEKIYGGPEPIQFWTPTTIEFDSVTLVGFELSSDAGEEPDFRYEALLLPVVLHAGESYELDGWFRAQAPGMRTARLRAITRDGVDATSYWYGNAPSSSADAPESAGGMVVSPNPASGETLLVRHGRTNHGGGELAMVDPLGNIVRSMRLEPGIGGTVHVDIGGVPAGVYFLRLTMDGKAGTQAVTIVR